MIFYVFEAFHLMAIPAPDSITVVTSYLLLCAQHHQNNLQISKPLGLSTCFQVNHKAEHFFFFIRFLWCNSFALAAISTSTSYEKRCSDPVNSALCLFAGVLPTALIINPSTIYNMPCFFHLVVFSSLSIKIFNNFSLWLVISFSCKKRWWQ